MTERPNANRIPEYMRGGIILYLTRGVSLGGFLTAVFEDSLLEAVWQADDTNICILHHYAEFLYNYAPMDSRGSRNKIEAWIKARSSEPIDALHFRWPSEWKVATEVKEPLIDF